MKRVMCVWFPHWPVQRWRQARPEPDRRPLVLFAPGPRGRYHVVACTRGARDRGVMPAMLLAEARALCPRESGVRFELHDAQADREALRRLAWWGGQFSPRVGLDRAEAPDGLVLDVTGCGYGFGGEEGLAAKAVASLRKRGCRAVAAIADTIGAAWAVARFAPPLPDGNEPQVTVVPPGRHAAVLRPLPVESLRLSSEVVNLLHEFDVRCVSQLMDLPRADLPSRFGPELLRRLDQALGSAPEMLTPERLAEVIEAAWWFEPPVADRHVLETVLGQLLEDLLGRLRPRQLGIRRLLGSLDLAAGDSLHFPVELLRPSLSHRHVMDLVRLRVERLVIPAEVAGVTIRVASVAPPEFRQGQMFDADGVDRPRQVAALLERLSSRLGESAVLRPRLRAEPQPELAFRCEPWLASTTLPRHDWGGSPPPGDAPAPARPSFLISQPDEITVVAANGLPARFHWEGRPYAVTHCWGPERIETGWWRGADVRRDYFLAETASGEWFWLFRALPDGGWFIHGVFA